MSNSNPQFIVTLNGRQVVSIAGPTGERATMGYNALGSLVRCVDARGLITSYVSNSVGRNGGSAKPSNERTTMPFDVGDRQINLLGVPLPPVTHVYDAGRKKSGLHFPDGTPVAAVEVVSANPSARTPIVWGSPESYAALSELHQTLLRLQIELNPRNLSVCMEQLFRHSEYTTRLESGCRVVLGRRKYDLDLLEEIGQVATVQFFELVKGNELPYVDDGAAYFGGWLTLTLYRKALDAKAVDDKAHSRANACPPEFFMHRADDSHLDSPSDDYREAVQRVPDTYLRQILLDHIQGLTIAEMADDRGLTTSKLHRLFHEAAELARQIYYIETGIWCW